MRMRHSYIEESGAVTSDFEVNSSPTSNRQRSSRYRRPGDEVLYDATVKPYSTTGSRRQSLCMTHMRPAENSNAVGIGLLRGLPQTTSDLTSTMLSRTTTLARATSSNRQPRRQPRYDFVPPARYSTRVQAHYATTQRWSTQDNIKDYSDADGPDFPDAPPPPTLLTYTVADPQNAHAHLKVQFDPSFVEVHSQDTSEYLELLQSDSNSRGSAPADEPNRTALLTELRNIEQLIPRVGEGLLEVERKLHSWLIHPPVSLPDNVKTHGGVSFPANRIVGTASGAPSHFVTVNAPKGFLIPYVSDCYDSLNDREVWQAWIHLARSGAAALLANGIVLAQTNTHQANRVVVSLCSRHFAQYGLVMLSAEKRGSVQIYPLTGRLSWNRTNSRKKLQSVSIIVAVWIRTLSNIHRQTQH